MDSQKLIEQRAGLVAQARQLVNTAENEKRDLTEQETQTYSTWMQDVDNLAKEIANVQRKEKLEATEAELRTSQGRKVSPVPTRMQDITVEDRQAALRAWALAGSSRADFSGETSHRAALCGINLNSSTLNLRALSKGTTTAGGYSVPVSLQTQIEKQLAYYSNMREYCKVWVTDAGQDYDYPTVNDTASLATITSEAGNVAVNVDATFGKVTFKSERFTSPIVKVSVELLQDSAVDIEALLADLLVERIARKQESEFTVGAGGGSAPNGIVTGAASVAVNLATGNAITFAKLKSLEHGLDLAYRNGASFVMHDSTFAAIEQLADSTGRPLFMPGYQGLSDGSQYKLFGYPVHINNSIANYSGSEGDDKPMILFGNFSKYVIRDVAGSNELVRFNELYAGSGQVGFLLATRAWGDYIAPACVSLNSYDS